MKSKERLLDNLLLPSWLSGLIAVVAGLVLTIGVIVSFNFNNSQVQQQITGWEDTASSVLTLPGQSPPGTDSNSLQNTWPLLGFWMVIGLVVYFVVEAAARSLGEAAEFKRELGFVNARRQDLLRGVVEATLVRAVAAAAWIIFIDLFFKRIIPYSITAAQASASDLLSLTAILYIALSFCMIVLSLHAQTILLRLMAGRPRLFSIN